MLRSCKECVGEVYLPVLSSVLEAPPTSPLYEIDAANMADFIIYLTQPTQPNVSIVRVVSVYGRVLFIQSVQLGKATNNAKLTHVSDTATAYIDCDSALQEESVHGNLAYTVANTVLSDPTSPDVRVYTRSLSQMTFTPANLVGAHPHSLTASQPTPTEQCRGSPGAV